MRKVIYAIAIALTVVSAGVASVSLQTTPAEAKCTARC
jgi:hypothetical protein